MWKTYLAADSLIINDKRVSLKVRTGVYSEVDKKKLYSLVNKKQRLEGLKEEVRQIMQYYPSEIITYSRNVFIPLSTLCRNRCNYCGFINGSSRVEERLMVPEQVFELLTNGRKLGCKEALFVLGERPEEVEPKITRLIRSWGYKNIIDYLYNMCLLAIDQGLLPHTNAGVLNGSELALLCEVNVSMGLMLENASKRLCESGGPHEFSPGKNPLVRLQCIEEAGKQGIPFTTGILVGIGENIYERMDSLMELKRINDRYGHIQEIIIQNFCPKKGTPMESFPEPLMEEMIETVLIARLIFGPKMNIQVPPNLNPGLYVSYIQAGANDWGGISPLSGDIVNPEKPWPSIAELRRWTEKSGYQIKERLAIYPEFIKKSDIPPLLKSQVLAMIDQDGYAKKGC